MKQQKKFKYERILQKQTQANNHQPFEERCQLLKRNVTLLLRVMILEIGAAEIIRMKKFCSLHFVEMIVGQK